MLIMCFSDVTATDDPPRPTFDSVLSRDMAGYMPARADFMEVRGYMFPYLLCANNGDSLLHLIKTVTYALIANSLLSPRLIFLHEY